MILKEGDTIEIRGKRGTICYTTKHNDKNYICVAFEENENISFELFKYKYENSRLLVTDDLSEVEKIAVLKIFVQEGLSKYQLSDELKEFFYKMAEQKD